MGEGEGTGGNGGSGGAGNDGGTGGGGGGEQTVPLARLQSVVAERDQLREQLGARDTELQKLTEKAATADTLAQQLAKAGETIDEYKGKVKAADGRYERYRSIAGHGITEPELVDAVEQHWLKTPEKDRPALGDMLAGWKPTEEAPDALDGAPLLLRPHLQTLWSGKDDDKPPKDPKPGHRRSRAAPPGTPVTATDIYAAAEMVRTGAMSQEDFDKLVAGG